MLKKYLIAIIWTDTASVIWFMILQILDNEYFYIIILTFILNIIQW